MVKSAKKSFLTAHNFRIPGVFLAPLAYLQRKKRTYHGELEHKMQKHIALRSHKSHKLAVKIRAFCTRPTLRTYRASLYVSSPASLNRQGTTFYRAQYTILQLPYRANSSRRSKSGSLVSIRARGAASRHKAALTKTILLAMASSSL